MKIRHLLLGLMICVAGTGAIDLSGGYLDDQNTTQLTPFLIFGHVLYEGGAPCNSLNVSITNLNTGAAWYADTVPDSNFYQTLLRAADVGAGDVLRWSTTDGTVFDTANRTVGQSDLGSGGIFDFDMLLQSIAPGIIGYAPESPVYDTGDATRRFNITIDQVVDVTWLINSSPAQTNKSVTDASYKHTNVAVGVWNVSARASNANGTDMQEWIWNVTTLPPPVNRGRMLEYSSSNTTEPVLFIVYGWVFYENSSGCTGAVVNITNLNTGMQWTAETHPGHYYYQLMLDAENVSARDMLQIDASRNDLLINRTYNITDAAVSDGATMVDLNEGSIDLTVSEISPPLYFCAGRNSTIAAVVANNGTACTDGFEAALFVNGTPTGTVHVPSTGPGGNRSVDFNWMPDHEGNYTIVVMADSGWAINETDESNNNRSEDVHVKFTDIDLVIMGGISLNKTPLDGDVVGVDVTIANHGNNSAENFTVVFYDNDIIFHTEMVSLNAGDLDNLSTCWYASYGEHDVRVIIDPDGGIWETDETNNEGSLSVSVNRSRDFAVANVTFALDGEPCSSLELEWGKNVTINATVEAVNLANRDCPVEIKFYRNAYGEYPSHNINETELLFETGNSTQYVTVEWHIDDRYSTGDLHMTAIIDPDDKIHELDESNNERVISIHVNASDFTVTNITPNATSVIFGEIVELNATIENLGSAAGDVDVAFRVSSADMPERRDISVSGVSVDAYGEAYAPIHWNTSETNLAGNCMVTVEVDPDHRVPETDETNNSMMTQNSIFVNGTDLVVCGITLDTDGIELYQGDVVDVSALIENRGAIDAFDFSMGFYDYDELGNVSLVELTNISSLLAGGSMCVNATWDLSGASININHTMLVKIDHCDNPENDVGNNEEGEEREVITPWEVVNISFPRFPDEDEDVTIAATVRNNGRRAGIANVEFYLDDKLFKEKELYVDANSTNSTGVIWDTRLTFIGPTNIQTSHQIKVDAGDHAWDNQEITIVPASLTADIFLNPDYDITVTARNNEDRMVNTTLWIYDVDRTIYTISGTGTLTIFNPDALNMCTHFFGEIDHSNVGEYNVSDDEGNLLDRKEFEAWGTTPIDAWSKWGAGSNIIIAYRGIRKQEWEHEIGYATIESGAMLNSMPVTLKAGETKNFTIEWNVTKRNHTLWAQLGNTNDSIYLNFDIDLAINVSMNDTVLDGDQETITAAITNLGHGNASVFKVEFSNDTNLFHTANVTYLDGSAITTVTANWTASTWNESEGKATLNHTIEVKIVPCENADINLSNNHINKIVRVSPTRDFSVTDITFAQDEETEETTIGALIRNFGRAWSTNVSICVNNSTETTPIYSGSHWVDSECYVNVTWNASMVGDCTINVTADPDNRILETNESNNSMTLPVYIEAPDMTVESLMIDPTDLIEGDITNITATVANIGDRDVDNVMITFCDRGNHIRRGDWNLRAGAPEVTMTEPDAAGIRVHFKKLEVPGGANMSIYDENGNQVIDMMDVNTSNMWTEWIPGSSVRIKISDLSICFAKIDRYEYHKIFNRTNLSLDANTSTEIWTNWTAYPAGPHEITVIVDPDDVILELNETDNELMNFTVVQGPDISVNLTLNNTNPVDGDIITITAQIKNTGVLPANNFTVKIDVDEGVCVNESRSLLPNESFHIFATWKATIGDHTIRVIADPDETIFETSEENNAVLVNVFVNAPDLNVTNIELNPDDLVDGDETWMNATITNQGFQQANNFSADIFYEYGKFEGALAPCERYSIAGGDSWGERWVNLTWNNKTVDAGCIYIHIEEISGNPLLSVFDGNNTPVTNSTTSRWIAVMGNATNISIYAGKQGHSRNSIALRFYAGNMTRFNGLTLDTNEAVTLGMRQKVSTGSHNIRVFADARNSVNENNKENNIREETVEVQPSRDFLVSYISVSANGCPININNTPLDGDPVTVNAIVGNTGFRKGIVDIAIIDEHGWADANPRYELTSYGYAYVIGYPGADAIKVHFSKLDVSPNNVVEIRDEDGTLLCTISKSTSTSLWLDSDKIYVYRVMKPTAYGTYKYIACDIDMYQYRKINRTTVELAANGTACIHARFNSSAGNHTIYVIADPDDKTGELNESNNEANETIYVNPCRDPAVVDITFSPVMPYPEDAVNITATVANNGNRTATFTVDLTALKSEYRPYESLHGSGLTMGFDEAITTYPEADWTGVHFTRISTIYEVGGFAKTFLRIYDGGGNMSAYYYGFEGMDIWEWVHGDVSRVTIPKLSERSNIWGCSIDKVAHIITLNRTTVTLHPGETANITGVLPNVRIGHRSLSYTVTARVDQDNTAFETDESNNAVSKVLTARCPDLTVGKNLHFTNDGKAKVVIKNIGTGEAEDVEVRFWHDADFNKYKKEHHRREHSSMKFPPRDAEIEDPDEDSDEYPNAVRVHFDELRIHRGTLRVYNRTTKIHTIPHGEYSDKWVEVEGEECSIYYDSAYVKIDRYEYAKDESVGDISAGGTRKWEIPWTGYEEPYNLTIYVDPGDDITESNEDNNDETIEMGADIAVSKRLSVFPYAPIMGDTCYIREIKNIGNLPTGEFNAAISINATDEIAFEHNTTINETVSLAPNEVYIFPWETPEVDPPEDVVYNIRIVADPEDVVKELREDNDEGSGEITVYSHTNYTGGKLYLYDTDWVYGNINYTIGDSTYGGGGTGTNAWKDYVVNFEDVIPENIKGKDIKLARLYLYWTWSKTFSINESKPVPVPAEVNVKFNNGWISEEDRRYLDYPHATAYDVAWGTYAYEIPSDAVKPDNLVIVDRTPFRDKYESDPYYCYPYACGIFGVGLLVIYESDDGVLTNYWINEGGDVIYGDANALGVEDMFTTAVFEGEVEDEDMTNATLWTVVPGGAGDVNALRFNNKVEWESAWDANIGIDHHSVTEHLSARDNTAELQYIRGGSMMSSGAFLFLRYPPDLNLINLTAPASTVVGAHHSINVTIRNDGRSDAHDFNVTLYIDGMKMVRIPHLDLPAGNSTTIHLYNWTPMMLVHVYNLTAAADVLSGEDWTEIETDNNAMTKRVLIEEGGFGNQTGPRGPGGGSNPTGGEYTEKITGRIMQGMKEFLSFGGGGGAGMFSALEWILKGAVWLTLLLFVCVGYWMEQRNYGRVSAGYAEGL